MAQYSTARAQYGRGRFLCIIHDHSHIDWKLSGPCGAIIHYVLTNGHLYQKIFTNCVLMVPCTKKTHKITYSLQTIHNSQQYVQLIMYRTYIYCATYCATLRTESDKNITHLLTVSEYM